MGSKDLIMMIDISPDNLRSLASLKGAENNKIHQLRIFIVRCPLGLLSLFCQVSAGDIISISPVKDLCLHAARVELELW